MKTKQKETLPTELVHAQAFPVRTVAVIGAGAVGAFYGSRLQRMGLQVEYQSGTMAKTKRLRVNSVWGSYTIPVRAFARSEEMQPADVIIVALKALPEIPTFEYVRPVLKKESVVLLLQNGINQEERLAGLFRQTGHSGRGPGGTGPIILGGLAFTCINRISPSRIDHQDYGLVKIGPLREKDRFAAGMVASLFTSAGVKCEAVSDLRKARWEKLLWNAAFNPLSVLLRETTDPIVQFSPTADLSLRMMREVQAVAMEDGYRLTNSDVKGMLERTRKMRPYKTSMLLDYEAGRPMEVDAILGEVVRLARKKRIQVPHLEMAFDLLRLLDTRRGA